MKSTQKHLTDEEITVLLLGESGFLKTKQAKKHILECLECQNRCEEFASVWQTTRIYAEKPLLTPKKTITSRRWVLAVMGIATITGVALLARPGSVGGPTVSFAQVEKAMGEVKTVGWTEVYQAKKGRAWTRQCWASLVPDKMYTQDISSRTIEVDGYFHEVMTYKNKRTFHIYRGDFSEVGIVNLITNRKEKRSFRETIEYLISAPDLISATKSNDTSRSNNSSWKKSSAMLEDRETIRFDQDATKKNILLKLGTQKLAWQEHTSIWIDPKTHRAVRRETDMPTIGYTTILKDFHYNETPPREMTSVPQPNIGETYEFRGDASNVTPEEQEQIVETLKNYHPKIWFASWHVVSVERGRKFTEGTFTHTATSPYPPTAYTRWSLYAKVEITTKGGKKNTDKAHFVFVSENGKMKVIQDSLRYLWPPRRVKN